jgi:hypothetical protein
MRILMAFCVCVVLLDSCITPFDINISDSTSMIIVDGMITDQPGPYTVKIFHSADLDDQIEHVNWFKGATVFISDDEGNSEKLKEVTPGNYQTSVNGIQGTVGRSYTVRIITPNENVYESLPEKLLPVGEFRNLYYEFEENTPPETEDFLHPQNGFNIYVDAQVLSEQEGLVRWRTTKIFEMRTFPELHVKKELFEGRIVTIPDPYECSGYVPGGGEKGLQYVHECRCCECWVTRYDEEPILSDKQFTNEGEIRKNKILFLPTDRRTFYKKFYLQIEQMSLSAVTYKFWQDVGKQKEEGSNLFQTPPSKTTGNIIAKTNDSPKVLGIFSASSIKIKKLFLSKADAPYYIVPIDTLVFDCKYIFKNSSRIKPAFW